MAKFIFRMQNILSIKERLESQEKTAYAQAAAKLAAEEEQLRRLMAQRNNYEVQLRDAASDTLNLKAMHRLNEALEVMKLLIQRQYLNVKVAEKNLDAARGRLNKAMQERKTYEKLKEKAFDEFKLELNAEEKKEIDELVSFNYNDVNKEAE